MSDNSTIGAAVGSAFSGVISGAMRVLIPVALIGGGLYVVIRSGILQTAADNLTKWLGSLNPFNSEPVQALQNAHNNVIDFIAGEGAGARSTRETIHNAIVSANESGDILGASASSTWEIFARNMFNPITSASDFFGSLFGMAAAGDFNGGGSNTVGGSGVLVGNIEGKTAVSPSLKGENISVIANNGAAASLPPIAYAPLTKSEYSAVYPDYKESAINFLKEGENVKTREIVSNSAGISNAGKELIKTTYSDGSFEVRDWRGQIVSSGSAGSNNAVSVAQKQKSVDSYQNANVSRMISQAEQGGVNGAAARAWLSRYAAGEFDSDEKKSSGGVTGSASAKNNSAAYLSSSSGGSSGRSTSSGSSGSSSSSSGGYAQGGAVRSNTTAGKYTGKK